VLAVLGLVLCAYLTFPAWRSVHLEGFTAQTQSIAFLKSFAPSVQHDPYLPRVTQFIEETRSGVVDILALLYRLFPHASDYAFRGLILASFTVLLVGSIAVARRWGGTPALLALFGLILTPGIPETAFFFNDNMVSAAFAVLGLAVLTARPSAIMALLSGASCAVAILCRLDAVFMLPMILGTLLHATSDNRRRIVLSVLGVAGAFAVFAASAWINGFSLLDAFTTARQALQGRMNPARWVSVRAYFFGLAVLPFLVIGARLLWRRWKAQRAGWAVATFITYPVLLVLFAPAVTEIRYIFPLMAPAIAMHAGAGLQWVAQRIRSGSRLEPRIAQAIAAFAILVFLSPPAVVTTSDGPRSLLGRLWSPLRWAEWQDSVRESMSRIARLVTELDDGGRNLVLSTHYNDEFYLRLRLMEAGFLPQSAAARFPGCKGFSLLTKGPATVIHVRTHPQYDMAPVSAAYAAALNLDAAFSCPALQAAGKMFVTTFGDFDWALDPHVYSFSASSFAGPATLTFADASPLRRKPESRNYGYVMVRELKPAELSATLAKARDYLGTAPEDGSAAGGRLTIDDYERDYHPIPGPTAGWLSRQHAVH
jgi:hypothetical protein